MRRSAPTILLLLVAALTIAAVTIVGRESLVTGRPQPAAVQFQRILGGLGVGPAVDLSGCEFSFDPRICPEWRTATSPILGDPYYCTGHASSILFLRPLEAANDLTLEEPPHEGAR